MTGEMLELSAISLSLGSHRFAFDLSVEPGTLVAVTGPSGSGKTTLFNLIAGFETPEAGLLLIDGKDVTRLRPSLRPISLVFQDNNLFAHLDVFTNVALGVSPALRLSSEDRERVSDALSRVGLAGFETRLPSTLSGGERQRVAFARVLVRRRPLVLLDEPFAALDPDLRVQMGELLLDLQRTEGFTVLMITHDREEARRLAQCFVRIETGSVATVGPIRDLGA